MKIWSPVSEYSSLEQPRTNSMTSPINRPKKDTFNMYSLSPHLPQFQRSTGATPSSLYLIIEGSPRARKAAVPGDRHMDPKLPEINRNFYLLNLRGFTAV